MNVYGRIYKITNLVNGKIYVGQTTKSVAKRWSEHVSNRGNDSGMLIARAIKKYGAEAFSIEEVFCANSKVAMNDAEAELMPVFGALSRETGYNIKPRADGVGSWSQEMRDRKSAKQKGKAPVWMYTPEARAKHQAAVEVAHAKRRGIPLPHLHTPEIRARCAAAVSQPVIASANNGATKLYFASQKSAGAHGFCPRSIWKAIKNSRAYAGFEWKKAA